jgi:hypothetical protein
MKNKNISKFLYFILISFLIFLLSSACKRLGTIEVINEPAPVENTLAGNESTATETQPTTTEEPRPDFNLVMVPVVPFYTYNDEIIFDDIKKYWNGDTRSYC